MWSLSFPRGFSAPASERLASPTVIHTTSPSSILSNTSTSSLHTPTPVASPMPRTSGSDTKPKTGKKKKKWYQLSIGGSDDTHSGIGVAEPMVASEFPILATATNRQSTTQPIVTPVRRPAATTLRLPLRAIITRPAFVSSFRSFLVSKYCQENIDFLMAVEWFTVNYNNAHPNWQNARSQSQWQSQSLSEAVQASSVYDASVKKSTSSSYQPLGLDRPLSELSLSSASAVASLSPSAPPPSVTNLPKTALEIFHSYILLTGSQCVNLSAPVWSKIETTVRQCESNRDMPVSVSLTPAVFSEAVNEITALLEREWLSKFYLTPQYATLVQWMAPKDRHELTQVETTLAKQKLQEQLRRVASAVRDPAVSGLIEINRKHGQEARMQRKTQQLTVNVSTVPIMHPPAFHFSPKHNSGCAPMSPMSTIRPSAVRLHELETISVSLHQSPSQSHLSAGFEPDWDASPVSPTTLWSSDDSFAHRTLPPNIHFSESTPASVVNTPLFHAASPSCLSPPTVFTSPYRRPNIAAITPIPFPKLVDEESDDNEEPDNQGLSPDAPLVINYDQEDEIVAASHHSDALPLDSDSDSDASPTSIQSHSRSVAAASPSPASKSGGAVWPHSTNHHLLLTQSLSQSVKIPEQRPREPVPLPQHDA